jgi:magnesium chelatase subunit D
MTSLPFPALVGLELAQQALTLLAIDSSLRGVAIAAPAGTGKTSLARGLRDVLGVSQTPFIEVPASIDVENLLGGLDLETTLKSGQVAFQTGTLGRAHGGLVYVDGLNLLSDAVANLLMSVLDAGEIHIEREGVSRRIPARFALVGTYDPAEGIPRQHLLDRLGMIVPVVGARSAVEREEVLRRNLSTKRDSWDEDISFLYGLIQAAKAQLPDVTVTDAQLNTIANAAAAYGVQGHRAELFAVQAACAVAAADLRDAVVDSDIEMALRLVVLPRATQTPVNQQQEPDNQPPPPPESSAETGDESETPPPPPPPQAEDDETDQSASLPAEDELVQPEEIFEALAAELPEDLEDLPFKHLRRGRAGSRGTTEGTRGRHVRSVPGDPRRAPIDIVGTLRAAAPWQRLRAEADENSNGHLRMTTDDIRIKQYRTKAGALFCFVVDASGSMALHRMRQAKGAVNTLLEQAYVNRDRIALISFRGEKAELLMPPSQSVELARRSLDTLPTGGGTPLASALLMGLDVAEGAKSRGIMQTVLILLTDGRGNVALQDEADPNEELASLGRVIAESALHVIVVDTKRDFLSRGEAAQLATWLGADYAYLPNAEASQLAGLAQGAVAGA